MIISSDPRLDKYCDKLKQSMSILWHVVARGGVGGRVHGGGVSSQIKAVGGGPAGTCTGSAGGLVHVHPPPTHTHNCIAQDDRPMKVCHQVNSKLICKQQHFLKN